MQNNPGMQVVFTSGGTESNNWAIKGTVKGLRERGNHIIISAVEHPAVSEVAEYLQQEEGCEVTVVRVNEEGVVSAEGVVAAVRDNTILISISKQGNGKGAFQKRWEQCLSSCGE